MKRTRRTRIDISNILFAHDPISCDRLLFMTRHFIQIGNQTLKHVEFFVILVKLSPDHSSNNNASTPQSKIYSVVRVNLKFEKRHQLNIGR